MQKRRPRRSPRTEDQRTKIIRWRHRWLEAKPLTFTVLAARRHSHRRHGRNHPDVSRERKRPDHRVALNLTRRSKCSGRDIYIREGCVGCHSQMIRPFRSETERYGEYSKAGEFVYDHPFLWGSKRTGPDLHREGGKYPDAWHYNHHGRSAFHLARFDHAALSVVALAETRLTSLPARISALRKVGVPYPAGYENAQAQKTWTPRP